MNVPKIITSQSEQYGNYKSELIGLMDKSKIYKMSPDKYEVIIDKFWAERYFGSVTIRRLFIADSIYHDVYAVYVPTKEVNADWDYKIWHDNYPTKKLPKRLPLVVKPNAIEKWLKGCEEILISEDDINE